MITIDRHMKTRFPYPLSHCILIAFTIALCLVPREGHGQAGGEEQAPPPAGNREKFPRNFDESKVPPFHLPDLLIEEDGTVIDSPELWETKRRPEILRILETNLFGRVPGEIDSFESELVNSVEDGEVLIQQVVLTLKKEDRTLDIDLLVFLPAKATKPVPMILSMNFKGNHTVTDHPSVKFKDARMELVGKQTNESKVEERGSFSKRFPVEEIISRGWGLITYAREDIIVDAKEADFEHGAFGLFPGERQPDHWGGMAAWAWSMSRVIDYMESNPSVDAERIAVVGTSRLGRATLWAGAQDERIKVTIPNVAGKGSTSLLKRNFGVNSKEVMLVKTQRYCDNFRTWAERIDEMPFDAHFTLSLVAPRPMYISHAEEDAKVDHQGVFLALKAANPVYELYGEEGFVADQLPEIDRPVFSHVGMHIRSGKHDVLPYDWKQYLKFLDEHL
jgi:hypothetical protein